jgi:predicted porin
MKKGKSMRRCPTHSLIAGLVLAACGVAAQAQQVSVNGLLDISVGRSKAPGGASVTGVDSGKMSTSWYGFSGSEDLGGGLSAIFRMEAFLQVDGGTMGRFTGDAYFARNSYVGLAGKGWGTVTFGRNTTALFVTTLLNNAFGDSFGFSPSIRHYFTSGTVTGDTGWNDSLAYNSPNISGFSFGAMTALKEVSNGGNWSLNANYGAGPLSLSAVVQNVKKDGTVAVQDSRTWQMAGNYAVTSGVRLFAQYGEVDNKTTGADYKISGLGANVAMGVGAVLAQYSHVSASVGGNRNTYTLGYDHFLSKRTDVYAAAMVDKQDGKSSGNGYSVGVRHRF